MEDEVKYSVEDEKPEEEVVEDLEKEEDKAESAEDTKEEEKKDEEKQKEEKTEDEAKVYLERLQRTMAEFDNYRKRTDKEKAKMYDMGLINTVETILPVIDNFERALVTPCEDSSYVKGMEMIYKQMIDLLDSLGVSQIETKGQTFDTNIHNAVMHIEDDEYGEGEIVEEFQKGYIYKEDQVIRYSMVKVAN